MGQKQIHYQIQLVCHIYNCRTFTVRKQTFWLLLTYSKSKRFGLNIFYSEEKDWTQHTTRQCPLQRKCLQKNLIAHTHTHTHICTHTLPRIGCLIIKNVTITRQYDSQVNITNYNLSVSSINLCAASKPFLLISIPRSADPYSSNNSHEISVIVSCLISFNNIFLAW